MLAHPAAEYLHNNPNAYWCAGCWRWTLDCAHLVEPLSSPAMKLEHFQYKAVTWAQNVLEVTMNTGERYQFRNVSRGLAVRFAMGPGEELLKGLRFQRVRGRMPA
jgi:hypothetical protein